MKRLVVVALALIAGMAAGAAESDPLEGVLVGRGATVPDGYVPPILANGELTLALDWTCGMKTNSGWTAFQGTYLAGRRHSAPNWQLFNFARLNATASVDGRAIAYPEKWEQRLDVKRGVQTFRHELTGGVEVRTEAFVHYARNVVVFRRVARNGGTAAHEVRLGLSAEVPRDKLLVGHWETAGGKARRRAQFGFECLVDWPFEGRGVEMLWGRADGATCEYAHDGRTAVAEATFTLAPGAEARADFLLAIDSTTGTRRWETLPRPLADETVRAAAECPFGVGVAELQREHEALWAKYWAEGYVRLPDARMQRMTDVANYHVRCDRTPWSFPVGVLPSHWQGRYFGFDEMYIHQGLVSAGHLDDARHCPDFRYLTLPDAEKRVGHYGRNGGKDGAQWMWESVEIGVTEGCPVGFWQQHYFHMCTICRTAWTQYLYSDDLAWLREKGYPVISGCARFFSKNMIYRNPDGSVYLGKCTDLERLGPSRENAYMTTVGAIYTMRAFADASDALATNRTEAAEMRRLADGLLKSLPVDGERYVGYLGCKEETVATMAGGFPFTVFGRNDRRHVETCRHFIARGTKSGGNMYPLGSKVCPWYAGKMALSMIGLADDVEPDRWLRDAARAIGHFGESFEINEPGVHMHPWFTTASGTLLYAVNQMLCCDAEGEVWLGMAVPKAWNDFAFRLPAFGGLSVEAEVKGGKFVGLSVTPRHPGKSRVVRLRTRARFLAGVTPEGTCLVAREEANGETLLTVRLAESGSTPVIR